MLHLVVDVNDSITIGSGDQITIVFNKKAGRKSFISIDAPKDMPIKFKKGAKNHANTNGRTDRDR